MEPYYSLENNITTPKTANLLYYNARKVLEIVLIIFSLAVIVASFIVLLGITRVAPNGDISTVLIVISLGCVALLLIAIIARLTPIIKAWRDGRAASRLHVRIISLFSVVATLPALAVAIVAVVTFNMGLDRWFNNSTKGIVTSSINIANVYADETLNSLAYNAYNMKASLDNQTLLKENLLEYKRRMSLQAAAYNMQAAFLLSRDGTIYVSSYLGGEKNLPIPPKELIVQSQDGYPFPFQPGRHDYFGVIVKFNHITDTYLYVVRKVRPSVLEALRLTEYTTNRYRDMQAARLPLQIAFAVLYLCLFLVMWLSAILTGVTVANRLVAPIRLLIAAADKVARGELNVCLPRAAKNDDIGQLAQTFNYMVQELKTQRDDLILANNQIDSRRRFSEAVLAGVTAGVIGVDSAGKITMVNRSLENMFNLRAEELIGSTILGLSQLLGEESINQVLELARHRQYRKYKEQITILQKEQTRVYNIQVTQEEGVVNDKALVVTIDDITELVEAHRALAWAEVAKRIAHEIKNPLTPIQLAAERLKRRYSFMITQDKDIFDKCLNTIVRQVGDIGRMVNEFSAFARMPKMQLTLADIRKPLQEACFLIEISNSDIIFEQVISKEALWSEIDSRLLGQAFGNIIKNASESIESIPIKDRQAKGHILIKAYRREDRIIVEFIDNGRGLPSSERQKLLEPYITTRKKGTGLGLAIVRKTVEEHKGHIELHDAPKSFYNGIGAMIRMVFPYNTKDVVGLGNIDKNGI